ncbi:imidazoleglycerol-phosphate dehydratase [Desulfovibrio litoralis]|uniref:Imidazoleglycerol-phosphate dehydratase n=1 Tax=Desulfovibrio litoralis DSM 11393 TaxID=1121455 RepID=A0A1M7ST59_9BACT|nr:imidazoleglycerol-phosphate dehydratase [Desulfovibrio litoralis]SHN61695.1 imidazoleglycerol-phosphate dehydratase [Desulfovibrio litoralis DSM 11393]
MRTAKIKRKTKETDIELVLKLEGSSLIKIKTGYPFADHMLYLMAFWGGFGLELTCVGDLEIDAHHSLEDIGLALGKALNTALSDRKGIARIGCAKVPMDEALSEVVIDCSGRSYLVFNGQEHLPDYFAGQEKDVWREFFKSFASAAGINLHISMFYGQNGHHLLESVFKSLGLALSQAVMCKYDIIMSSKGSIEL